MIKIILFYRTELFDFRLNLQLWKTSSLKSETDSEEDLQWKMNSPNKTFLTLTRSFKQEDPNWIKLMEAIAASVQELEENRPEGYGYLPQRDYYPKRLKKYI